MNLETIRDYYGSHLQGSGDLLTDACATIGPTPPAIRSALADIHPEVSERYYGCGLIVPEAVEGLRVLDLGCGAGRDAYLLSRLVGEEGKVVGIDATPAQLEVAERTRDWHRDRYGYRRSNVEFVAGDIEALDEMGLENGSFDLIVSNCVVNLLADKGRLFRAAWRLLKEGGEFHFADVYADRRVPAELRSDPVLHGECLAGALYWGDFLALARAAGFTDPRLVTDRPIAIRNEEVAARLGGASFFSATYRLFRIEGLEPQCEDHGQAVIYKGTIPGSETLFRLDSHHAIEAGRVFPVCGNTFRMLSETRLAPHFDFIGDFSRHFGIFPGCGAETPFSEAADADRAVGSGCC